jgi:hypothetical protein
MWFGMKIQASLVIVFQFCLDTMLTSFHVSVQGNPTRSICYFLAVIIAILDKVPCRCDDSDSKADDRLRHEYLRYAIDNSGDAERGRSLFNPAVSLDPLKICVRELGTCG